MCFIRLMLIGDTAGDLHRSDFRPCICWTPQQGPHWEQWAVPNRLSGERGPQAWPILWPLLSHRWETITYSMPFSRSKTPFVRDMNQANTFLRFVVYYEDLFILNLRILRRTWYISQGRSYTTKHLGFFCSFVNQYKSKKIDYLHR